MGRLRPIRVLIVLLALSPIAGVIAALVWLFLWGCLAGFGWVWPSAFLDVRNYWPFIWAISGGTILLYFILFMCYGKLRENGISLHGLAVLFIVAALLPATVLTLDDDGEILEAISGAFNAERFSREFFRSETLHFYVSFVPSSVVLAIACWHSLSTKEDDNHPIG